VRVLKLPYGGTMTLGSTQLLMEMSTSAEKVLGCYFTEYLNCVRLEYLNCVRLECLNCVRLDFRLFFNRLQYLNCVRLELEFVGKASTNIV
ncbi:hypothetical protein L9F63_008368, partial [Diploptera punctata]